MNPATVHEVGAVRDRRIAPSDEWACGFLEQLVRTPSVSGNERAAVELFVRAAREVGLESSIDAAGNAIVTVRSPAAARGGDGPGADRGGVIVLLGHIDTVSGDIPVRIEDNILYGRGAVDAKGPLAAMLAAAARVDLDGGTTLHVVAAVGEETPESPGAHEIARSLRADACIIGEPSGVGGFALGYKGRLLVRARFELSHSHSAGPAGSAADAAFGWWSAVLGEVHRLNAAPAGIFDSLQASLRGFDSACDGLTDSATLNGGFRLPPRIAPDELERAIRALDGGPTCIEFCGHTAAYRCARDNAVAAALGAAIRDEGLTPRAQLKTGTADMNIVAPAWGCPIAAYGPGDSALDHAPDERLDLGEFTRSIRVLERAIGSLADGLAGCERGISGRSR